MLYAKDASQADEMIHDPRTGVATLEMVIQAEYEYHWLGWAYTSTSTGSTISRS